jgi:hypothetical protein
MQIVLVYYSDHVCLVTTKLSNHSIKLCILIYCQGEEVKVEERNNEERKGKKTQKLSVCWIT